MLEMRAKLDVGICVRICRICQSLTKFEMAGYWLTRFPMSNFVKKPLSEFRVMFEETDGRTEDKEIEREKNFRLSFSVLQTLPGTNPLALSEQSRGRPVEVLKKFPFFYDAKLRDGLYDVRCKAYSSKERTQWSVNLQVIPV
jgi:hypothetical protein